MKNLEQNITIFEKELKTAIESATSQDELERVRVAFLGRKGKVTKLMSQMKNLSI